MPAIEPLDRYLDPVSRAMTPEVAQAIVDSRPDPDLVARVEFLGDKASAGTLTDEERDEYEAFVSLGDLVTVLKIKARRLLGGA